MNKTCIGKPTIAVLVAMIFMINMSMINMREETSSHETLPLLVVAPSHSSTGGGVDFRWHTPSYPLAWPITQNDFDASLDPNGYWSNNTEDIGGGLSATKLTVINMTVGSSRQRMLYVDYGPNVDGWAEGVQKEGVNFTFPAPIDINNTMATFNIEFDFSVPDSGGLFDIQHWVKIFNSSELYPYEVDCLGDGVWGLFRTIIIDGGGNLVIASSIIEQGGVQAGKVAEFNKFYRMRLSIFNTTHYGMSLYNYTENCWTTYDPVTNWKTNTDITKIQFGRQSGYWTGPPFEYSSAIKYFIGNVTYTGMPARYDTPIVITSDADFLTYADDGDGSPSNPWIIENYIIPCGGIGSGVSVTGTTDHAIFRNIQINDTGAGLTDAAFYIHGVSNIDIVDCATNDPLMVYSDNGVATVDGCVLAGDGVNEIFKTDGTGIVNVQNSNITNSSNFYTGNVFFDSNFYDDYFNVYPYANLINSTTDILDTQYPVMPGNNDSHPRYDASAWPRTGSITLSFFHSFNGSATLRRLPMLVDGVVINSNIIPVSYVLTNISLYIPIPPTIVVKRVSCNVNTTGNATSIYVPVFIYGTGDFSIYASSGNGSSLNPWIIENYIVPCVDAGSGVVVAWTTDHVIFRNITVLDTLIYPAFHFSASNIDIVDCATNDPLMVYSDNGVATVDGCVFAGDGVNEIFKTDGTGIVNVQNSNITNSSNFYTGNVFFDSNFYDDYFNVYPYANLINSTTDILDTQYPVMPGNNDSHPRYDASAWPRTDTTTLIFFNTIDGTEIAFRALDTYVNGILQYTSSFITPVLFNIRLEKNGIVYHDAWYNKNITGNVPLSIGTDFMTRLYFSFFSTIDFFGLDFSLLKLFVNGTRVTTNSPTVPTTCINITVEDFANTVLYSTIYNVSVSGVYLDIGLPIAPITIQNKHDAPVLFNITRNNITTGFVVGPGMGIIIRFALGSYVYRVYDMLNHKIVEVNTTFVGMSILQLGPYPSIPSIPSTNAFRIIGDAELAAFPGITGTGTIGDPYIIDNYFIIANQTYTYSFCIDIQDTTLYVIFRGIICQGARDIGAGSANLIVVNASRVTFTNCTFQDIGDAVYNIRIENSSDIIMNNCTVDGSLYSASVVAVSIANSTDVVVTTTMITNSWCGINASANDDVLLTFNNITTCTTGVFTSHFNNTLLYNTIDGCGVGIQVQDFNNYAYTIYTLESNTVINSIVGVNVSNSNNTFITNMTITSADFAIKTDATSRNFTCEHVLFRGNNVLLLNASSINTFEYNYYYEYFVLHPTAVTMNVTTTELQGDQQVATGVIDGHPLYYPAWYALSRNLYVKIYSTIDFYGYDFDIVNVFIDGEEMAVNSIVFDKFVFRITVEDYASTVLYDDMYNYNTSDHVKIGLPITWITFVNNYTETVVFYITKGPVTLTYTIPRLSNLLVRLAMGTYDYVITNLNGHDLESGTMDFVVADPESFTMTFGKVALVPPILPSGASIAALVITGLIVVGVLGSTLGFAAILSRGGNAAKSQYKSRNNKGRYIIT